jgi:hypothetical protein
MYIRSDMGAWYDDLWSGVKKAGGVGVDVLKQQGVAEGQAQAYQAQIAAQQAGPQTPKWLLPVGIAAGAVVLVLILRKKR